MERLILSIRVENTSAWSAFYKQFLHQLFQQHGALLVEPLYQVSDDRLINYSVIAHDQKFIRYVQSISLQRILRRYGFSDRFSVLRGMK